MTLHLSVVIPAYNEARYLPRLLDTLDRARARYRLGAGAVEYVVADNGSTDDTARIARERGCRVAPVTPRIIAAVRNAGARAAQGELVAFIDADAQVHPETFNAVEDFFADPRHIVAVSGAVLERRSVGILIPYWIFRVFSVLGRYDTGFVCCRRADWEAVGGFREGWIAAEDVRFLEDLKRLGRPRGQKLGWLRGVRSVYSTRKWDEHGEWHVVSALARLPFYALFSWRSIREWVHRYWYGQQRERAR